MNLTEFHFIRPWWLLALIPLLGLLGWYAKQRLSGSAWRQVIDPALLPHVLNTSPQQRRRWPLLVIGVCGCVAVLALAGPAWERLPQPVVRSQSALVIALDLSRSMDATDLKPSRLARARFKIADILEQRREGQTALLVYAGDAFTVTPLTEDTATLLSQLTSLTTQLMPSRGSRADAALVKAGQLLKQAGFRRGHILLITDGVNLARARPVAAGLSKQGYRISVLGIGTTEGSPIKLPDGELLKDTAGNIVIPKLSVKSLRELAREGDGMYRKVSADDHDVSTILASGDLRAAEGPMGEAEVVADIWQEQGPWLLVFLMPLAAIAFRRGYLFIIVVLLVPLPGPAQALDWPGLWSRPDQRGMQALNRNDAEQAARLFNDPEWKAASQYRAGDYEGTLRTLEGLQSADALYNKGNALTRLGRYDEAVEAYEQTLQIQPDHEDAKYNRDLIAEQKEDQPQQPQGDRSDKSSEQQDDGSGQQSDSSEQTGNPSTDEETQVPQQARSNGNGANETEPTDTQQQESDSSEQERSDEDGLAQQDRESENMEPTDDGPFHAGDPIDGDRSKDDPAQQATEQWLRRIPDDPGGLLRRKFYYQYQRQNRSRLNDEQPW